MGGLVLWLKAAAAKVEFGSMHWERLGEEMAPALFVPSAGLGFAATLVRLQRPDGQVLTGPLHGLFPFVLCAGSRCNNGVLQRALLAGASPGSAGFLRAPPVPLDDDRQSGCGCDMFAVFGRSATV